MKGRLTCLDDSRLPEDQKELEILLGPEEATIGRSPDNTASINHSSISRRHAQVSPDGDGLVIRDLGSTNGVWLNGERVTEAKLGNGDTVGFGSLLFRFSVLEEPESAPEAPAAPEPPLPPETRKAPEAAPRPVEVSEAPRAGEPEEAEPPAGPLECQPGEDDGDAADRTMLFGDSRASEAILDAREKRAEEPVPDSTPKPRTATAEPEIVEAAPAPAPRNRRAWFAAGGIVLLALCVWWFIHARRTAADERLLNAHVEEIEAFMAEHEYWTRRFDPADAAAQNAKLQDMVASLEKDIGLRPDLEGLKLLLVEVRFLELERNVRALLADNRPEAALALVAQVRDTARGFTESLAKDSGETREALLRFISLSDLLDIVARYKLFQKKYQAPLDRGDIATDPDMRKDILEAKEFKSRFAALLKENNMPLKVRFRLLRGMAADADENCVLLVNRWHHLVFGEKPENG